MNGKFITFYGTNNKGKTTQIHHLVEWLTERHIVAEYLKYPVYNLEPFGPIISQYLRGGNPHNLTPLVIQLCYMANRTQYEPTLVEKLEAGVWVLAEDYTGTGIAWGMAAGVDKQLLVMHNQHLLKPDLAILFDGKRFSTGIEAGHLHEQDDELTKRSEAAHIELGLESGWRFVQSDLPEEDVTREIVDVFRRTFEL